MDSGLLIYSLGRLILGTAAAFLAILIWPKTRDAAWILVISGILAAYAEIVFSILVNIFPEDNFIIIGNIPLVSMILSWLPIGFFISALVIMALRKYRKA